MSFSKSFVVISSFALIATACGQKSETVASPAVEPVAQAGGGMAGAGMAGAGMAGAGMAGARLTPEQRAANAKAAMEASAAMTFSKAPLMDPNTASLMALASVPGLGKASAQKIVDARPFTGPAQMHAAISEGMSEADLKAVYNVLFVKVGLNSGDAADYQLIPTSLPPRKLAHEFEEYRPYKTMSDFTREMAKYVSAEEVDHLARYVTLD